MSAYLTANGLPVVSGRVSLPRVGVWVADLAIDAPEAPEGACSLGIGELSLRGTFASVGVEGGGVAARVVGGAGGMGRTAQPRGYRAAPLRVPLVDLLNTAGETLAGDSDADVLGFALPYWATVQASVGAALGQLVGALEGVTWRVNRFGQVWVGREKWQASALADFEELESNPIQGRSVLYAQAPEVFPGELLSGKRVSYVEHVLQEGGGLRTHVWFEAAT